MGEASQINEQDTRILCEVRALLERIVEEQQDGIDRAAAEIVRRLAEDRVIYVIGTGAHSIMVAMA